MALLQCKDFFKNFYNITLVEDKASGIVRISENKIAASTPKISNLLAIISF